MATKKTRLQYVDTAKFIAMVLVILCHAVSKGEIRHITYSFHMPVFFILNGITLKVDREQPFGIYLEKKLKGYLIPMFCLGMLAACAEIYMHGGKSPYDIWFLPFAFIKLLEQKRVYSLWFLGALLFADIIFYFIAKWSKDKIIPCFILSCLSLAVGIFFNQYYNYSFVWNIDAAFFGAFFIFFGYAFSNVKFEKVRKFLLDKRLISLLFGILLFVAGQVLGEYNFHKYNSHLEMWARNYTQYYLTLPCAILSSFGFILICNAITNKVTGALGRTTLVLLAFHQVLTIPLFAKWFSGWYSSVNSLSGDDIRYIAFNLTSTLFSTLSLVCVHVAIIYSPFAFMVNRKMPRFYKDFYYRVCSKFKKPKNNKT